MKHTTKALAVFLFALAVALGLLPGMATTAKAEGSNAVSYRDAKVDATTHKVTFTDEACTDYTTVDANTTAWGVQGQTTSWYVVKDKVEIKDTVTLQCPVGLILCNGAALTTGMIDLGGNNLTVYAQSEGENMGSLTASGSYGITADSGGSITINGGSVTASGSYGITSISGGGSITINGGSVTAYSDRGIGIYSNTGAITINGGSVTASGGSKGIYNNQGAITISGGTVRATATGSGNTSCGIESGGSISISGGTVTASGKKEAIYGTLKVAASHAVYSSDSEITEANKIDAEEIVQGLGDTAAITITRRPYMLVEEGTAPVCYPLWVGGTRVTNLNADDVLGAADGDRATVKFTPATDTAPAKLTLKGAKITSGSHNGAAIYAEGDLTIDVTADSAVTGPEADNSYGVRVKDGSVTVIGNGTLTATGGKAYNSRGVYISGNVDVHGTLIAEGGEATGTDGKSDGVMAEKRVTVTGTLTATGGEATGANGESRGVYVLTGGDVTVYATGKLTATGGTAKEQRGNSYGVYAYSGNVTVESNGTLTATGGTAYDNSYGVYAGGNVKVTGSGTLTATGGTAKEQRGNSYGVYAYYSGNVTVESNGTLTATGGTAKEQRGNSYGVYAYYGNVTVDTSGTLTGIGGEATGADGNSYGVYAYKGAVTVSGTLTATGGTADLFSCGVYAAGDVTVSGTLTATGGTADLFSYGVYTAIGTVNVNNNSKLTATGNTQAIHGTVKNAIAGTGWTDAAGAEGENQIPINDNSGQSLNYMKVMFPEFVKYSLWVGGTRVTNLNANDVLGDNTVKFTPATDTAPAKLTLKGAKITSGSHEGAAIYAVGDLTIDVNGTNTVTGPEADNSYGVRVKDGPVTVTGNGTLTATGGTATDTTGSSYGVLAENGITVSGTLTAEGGAATGTYGSSCGVLAENGITVSGTLTAEGGAATGTDGNSFGAYAWDGSVTVNGTLTCKGGTANQFSCGVYVYTGEVNVDATGTLTGTGSAANQSYGVYANKETVYVNANSTLTATGNTQAVYGTVKNDIAGNGWTDAAGAQGEAEIDTNTDSGHTLDNYRKVAFPVPVKYSLWVGGVQANSTNMNDLLGDNTVKFTPAEGTTPAKLTLNGAKITSGSHEGAAIYAECDLTIEVNGTNTVTGPEADESYGVLVQKNNAVTVTVTGNGTLTATGGKAQCSRGVFIGGNIDVSGTLTATGGKANILSYGVWASHAVTVKEGGTLIAEGGEATDTNSESYCVYAGGSVTVNGTLTATCGKATGANGESRGVYAFDGAVTVTGTLTATGGEANQYSYGVYAYYGDVNVADKGTLTATGGTANEVSYGVYAYNGAVNVADKGTLTGKGGTANKSSYGVWADKAVTVDANGTLTATGGTANQFSCGVYANNGAVTVEAKGTLEGRGGEATSTYGESYGVYAYKGGINANGTLTATGGEAKSNSYGVYASSGNVNANGTLTATGGEAKSNSYGVYAYNGDVTVYSDGTLEGIGGKATGTQGNSYGVYASSVNVNANGTLTGTGGTANQSSYGVCVYEGTVTVEATGTLTATGGEAVVNSHGVYAAGDVTVNGTLTATGGKANKNSCGVYAYDGNVTVNGTLTATGGAATGADGGSYGVYAGKAVTVNDNSKLTATGGTQAIGGTVKNAIAGTGWTDPTGVRGEVQIAKNADPGQKLTDLTLVQFPAHFHSFKYAADGATITATCSANGCRLLPGTDGGGDHVATLTVAADGGVYDGATAFSATVTNDIPAVEGVTVGAVEYYKVDAEGATADGTKQDSAPIDAGYYYASVTLTSGSKSYTAIKAFTVAKGDPGAPTVTMGGYTYGGTVSTPDISANPGSATVAYYYSTTDSASGGTAWENITATTLDANVYYMYAVIAESDNYNSYTTATASFTVSKAAAQTIEDVTDSQFYSLPSVSQSVAGKMPDDAGTLTYTAGTAAMTGSVTVSDFAVDDSGNVTAALSGGAAGDTVTLPVIISATNYADSTVNVVITLLAKGTQTVAAENVTVTYGDADKAVSASVTEPATGGGAISYAVKDGSGDYIDVDAATGALTIKRVPADGIAYVTATAAATDAFEPATTDVTVTVNRAKAVPATVAANNRVCDGEAKPLVTVDNTTLVGGEMQYAPGTDTEATQPYTTSIPTATDAGTYYVWYKVVGDDNHNSTEPVKVEVTISPSDKAALNKAIAAAKEYCDSIKDYTDIAAALKTAIDAAEKVAKNDNVTEADIAAAISTLNGAVDTAKADVKKAADEAAAKKAVDAINALPDNAGLDDKAAVEAARAAYDALTDDQKKLVPEDVLAKLTAAENQVKAAEEEAAKINIAKCKITAKNRVYTGKAITPRVTVKYGDKTLKAGRDYTLSYSKKLKAIGTAKVTVKGMGDFTGSRKVSFRIIPKGTSLGFIKVNSSRGKMTLKWIKRKNITGYQIQYSVNEDFQDAVKLYVRKTKHMVTVRNLEGDTTYYVRIRTFRKVDKKVYFSAWSGTKVAKTEARATKNEDEDLIIDTTMNADVTLDLEFPDITDEISSMDGLELPEDMEIELTE